MQKYVTPKILCKNMTPSDFMQKYVTPIFIIIFNIVYEILIFYSQILMTAHFWKSSITAKNGGKKS